MLHLVIQLQFDSLTLFTTEINILVIEGGPEYFVSYYIKNYRTLIYTDH